MKLIIPSAVTVTSSNVAGSSFTAWSSVTSYSIGNKVYVASNFGEYEALTANTNKSPTANLLDWKWIGTTNKYKMFDQYLNTQTTNSATITAEIVAYGAQALYLGNITATDVTIEIVNNDTLAVIETASFDMYGEVLDWQDYFYGDWVEDTKTSVTYERTSLTQNISILLTIDNGVGIAGCGIFASGRLKTIGNTLWNLSLGAEDYSPITVEPNTGATYLEKGNYAKKIGADIFAYTSSVPAVYKVLTDARATPLVFIAGGYEDFNVYGYIRTWETLVKGPVETAITAEIIGLI